MGASAGTATSSRPGTGTDAGARIRSPQHDRPACRGVRRLDDAGLIQAHLRRPGRRLRAHGEPDTGCLAVDDASTSSGALLAPRDCADSNSQKFRLEASGGGFRLRPLHSGLCIGFLHPVEDGAEPVQTACTGTSDQVFTFTAN
ncbi:RICIN domain-containing protein [Streptomyces acidicola]|uniref:RICIN domain-containing protein n=1 Tax=Streptomyces acidicola TaxID=2596892 RepID=UPI00380B53DC